MSSRVVAISARGGHGLSGRRSAGAAWCCDHRQVVFARDLRQCTALVDGGEEPTPSSGNCKGESTGVAFMERRSTVAPGEGGDRRSRSSWCGHGGHSGRGAWCGAPDPRDPSRSPAHGPRPWRPRLCQDSQGAPVLGLTMRVCTASMPERIGMVHNMEVATKSPILPGRARDSMWRVEDGLSVNEQAF